MSKRTEALSCLLVSFICSFLAAYIMHLGITWWSSMAVAWLCMATVALIACATGILAGIR